LALDDSVEDRQQSFRQKFSHHRRSKTWEEVIIIRWYYYAFCCKSSEDILGFCIRIYDEYLSVCFDIDEVNLLHVVTEWKKKQQHKDAIIISAIVNVYRCELTAVSVPKCNQYGKNSAHNNNTTTNEYASKFNGMNYRRVILLWPSLQGSRITCCPSVCSTLRPVQVHKSRREGKFHFLWNYNIIVDPLQSLGFKHECRRRRAGGMWRRSFSDLTRSQFDSIGLSSVSLAQQESGEKAIVVICVASIKNWVWPKMGEWIEWAINHFWFYLYGFKNQGIMYLKCIYLRNYILYCTVCTGTCICSY